MPTLGERILNLPVPEQNLLGMAAGYALHRRWPWILRGSRTLHALVGAPLMAAGVYVALRAWVETAQIDLAHPERLLTSGPYAVIRHPIYVGWSLIHLGAGIAAGVGWVVATLPAAAAWSVREARIEERALRERFGEDFERYRAAVPALRPARRAAP